MKRIVVCCDGTWNTPDQTSEGIPVATNVVRIAEAVRPRGADGTRQELYYDPGVGTSGWLITRLFDGATGSGLSRNIMEAYRFLMQRYEPGDRLYLMGFSRGAFTVRSLAGLIRSCGILRRDADDRISHAFALYRSRRPSTHPRLREATLFRTTYAVEERTRIAFIGVFDTVGTLGNPLFLNGFFSRRQRFHDTTLSSTVENAFQALAVDERRRHFTATLWNRQDGSGDQRLEQVWFPGAHSGVGGGLRSTGLSDIALEWLIGRARDCGLDIAPVRLSPDPLGPMEESWKGLYRIVPPHDRPIDKPKPGSGPTHESLHPSVLERYRREPSYRPRNLCDFLARHPDLLGTPSISG